MLVLSRKANERILIGDGNGNIAVTILVVELRGDKVRIGIEADQSVPVHREEVWNAIQAERNGQHKESDQ